MVSSEDAPNARPGSARSSKRQTAAAPKGADSVVVVTLRVGDGAVLKIEAADSDGARHDLTAAEAATFLGEPPPATLKGLVHEAFEAGIACILDDRRPEAAADEASGESQEDTLLHDELLDALIEQSPARRLLQRKVLNSALLGAIISQASGATPAPAG